MNEEARAVTENEEPANAEAGEPAKEEAKAGVEDGGEKRGKDETETKVEAAKS